MTGCLSTPGVPCGAGRVCAEGTSCVHDHCVDVMQQLACIGRPDGASCVFRGHLDGVCRAELCLPGGCGDGLVAGAEQCDGADLGRATDCASVGLFGSAPVACAVDCRYDVSACEGSCGDGVVQTDHEECDGDDLGGSSCASAGFHGGALTCLPNCKRNLSGCVGRCGDGTRTAGEECDGNDFGGRGCADLGFHTGHLACSADCQRIDTGACSGTCGDGVRNGDEVCDGGDTPRASCRSLGWNGGALHCLADCSDYDTRDCTGYCGDGVANGTELCDGLDQRGESCTSFGARGGGLGCDAACRPTFERCHWANWRRVPDLALDTRGVSGSGDEDVWLLAREGIRHFDGLRWREVAPPGDGWIRQIVSGGDDVWLAAGRLYRRDGDSWRVVDEVSGYAVAIWRVGADDVWVATRLSEVDLSEQAVFHFDGHGWSRTALTLPDGSDGEPDSLRALWGPGGGDMWATTLKGGTLRLVDGAWTRVHESGEAIWGVDSSDVWIVGDLGIEHFDGSRWTLQYDVRTALTDIWGTAPDDVWATGGSSSLVHFDGHAWHEAPINGQRVNSGWSATRGDAWATTSGGVHHYDGPGWAEVLVDTDIAGAWSRGRDDVWFVDRDGRIRHFDGRRWTETATGAGELYGVWSSGPGDVWVVGEAGVILHFDGAAWTAHPSGTSHDLWEVFGTSPSDVWAVGRDRAIVHFDGVEWRPAGPELPEDPHPGPEHTFDFRRLWASGPDDVWVVANLRLLHYDGASWEVRDLDAWLVDISGTGRDDVWLLDEDGVLHDDGTGLRRVFIDPDHSSYAVRAISPHDVWLFGENASAHHYDGASWTPVDTGLAWDINKVRGSGDDDVWAISFLGSALLHLDHRMPTLHGGACRAPIPLYCQGAASGATYGADAHLTHYAGAARDDAGGEVVYRLESPITGRVRVAMKPRHADLDLIGLVGSPGTELEFAL